MVLWEQEGTGQTWLYAGPTEENAPDLQGAKRESRAAGPQGLVEMRPFKYWCQTQFKSKRYTTINK